MPIVVPLVALDVLVLVLWTIAAALAIALIMREIGNILRGIPIVGGYLAGAVGAIANAVSTAVGILERGIDKLIGAAWHLLARYMDMLWHQIEAQSSVLAQFGHIIGNQIYSVTGLRSLVHRLEKVWHGIEHGIRTLTREWHGIERRVKAIERTLARGIGNDVRAHVKALEQELTGIEKRVIPDLRAGIRTAEGEVTQLEQFIKAIPGTRYFDWAAGIVTAALGLEIWNLFRCPSLLSSARNRGCGLWNGLEDLLGLFIDALLLTNICELLPIFETLVSDVADPLVVGLTDVGAGLCSGGIGAAPALAVPALSLPANPGVTLNLP